MKLHAKVIAALKANNPNGIEMTMQRAQIVYTIIKEKYDEQQYEQQQHRQQTGPAQQN